MSQYRFVSYELDGVIRSGIRVGELIFDIADGLKRPELSDPKTVLSRWHEVEKLLSSLAKSSPAAAAVSRKAKLVAPISNPGAIYCAGANYRDHIEEMAKRSGAKPVDPRAANIETWFFLKTPVCIVGPDAMIELPSDSCSVDWEAEFAVIVGRTPRNVSSTSEMIYSVAVQISQRT